jgi:hypothetical protein
MALQRPSRSTRDPENMLVGLDNIKAHKNRNFIRTDEEEKNTPVPATSDIPLPAIQKEASEETQKEKSIPEIREEIKPILQAAETINVIKKKPGRKKKYDDNTNIIRINVTFPENNYMFIKQHGWEQGSMNSFINWLIEEEMKRRGE